DTATAGGQSGAIWAGVQAALSQGCKRESLYARDSFQRPNGLMLPYYVPLGAVGLPAALRDPYVSPILAANPFSIDPNLVDTTNDQIEDLRTIETTIDPKYAAESNIGELQVNFDLTDTLTLSSETAYATDTVYSLQDFNRFNTAPGAWEQPGLNDRPGALLEGPDGGIFCDPQLGCSDRLVAVDVSTATSWQFSQELRLASDLDGAFNFSLGANFLRADSEDKYYVFINSLSLISARGPLFNTLDAYVPNVTDNIDCLTNGYIEGDPNAVYAVTGCQYIDPNPIESVNDEGHNYFLSKNPYKLISYAVFGETYYQVADNLKVTAGLRWTVDKKEAPRIPTWILGSNSVGYPIAEVIEQEWREPTGRLAIDWKPDLSFTDETLVYASYAHGYKAGGANPPGYVRIFYADPLGAAGDSASSLTRPMTFDPEFVNAYELGSKNTLADGRVTVNLAAFYYDYEGYQVSEIVDRSAFNRNFDAEVWGAEIEADWRPLENLRFGLKGGYEKTRIADGEEAIDLMDRTAGDPNWLVVRPFPTYASSCILPTFVFVNPNGTIGRVGGVGGGGPSGCEIAYQGGHDPVTDEDYVDLTQNPPPAMDGWSNLGSHPGYPGWDPSTAPNGGEGIAKQLGGNQLPNAPKWTWTITGDYTLPLAGDWLVNLHTDLHWQSESYWRVFNDHAYDKLKAYTTMNLAAIFTNEEAGWNIMAYVKNVFDETAITGAFLNSDDTGLTTNVFLTEPRLYGLRVTKAWWGGPTLGSFGQRREGPFPFTVEIGGQVQRHDAPNTTVAPSYASAFTGPLDINGQTQQADLDWGDGRDVKLTYRPQGGPWTVSLAARYGKTNGYSSRSATRPTDPVCFSPDQYTCEYLATTKYAPFTAFSMDDNAQARAFDHEEHTIVDFAVGRDFGLGGLTRSTVSGGLRYAQLKSFTRATLRGVPDWTIEDGFFYSPYPSTHHVYTGATEDRREFEGTGPELTWEAAWPLLDAGHAGRVDVDWSLSGGVLFGKRSVDVTSTEEN
ncbi:MAG TPA: TonB-dependent receptor, partial [Caulobacteraceae bacterium]